MRSSARPSSKTAVSAIEKAYDFESASPTNKRARKAGVDRALTGLRTAASWLEALTQELRSGAAVHLALTILLADIDRFKSINDTRGHSRATRYCGRSGELLRREARSVDITARYGGEEFVIVMPETLRRRRDLCRALRRRVMARDFADPGEIRCT